MICSCGARYPDTDKSCTYCGAANAKYKAPEAHPPSDTSGEPVVPSNPWDAFPGKQPKPEQGFDQQHSNQSMPPWGMEYNEQEFEERVERSARVAATISLISGILGNIVAGPIFGTIAILLGTRAKRLGYPGGKATAGVVLGIIALVFWFVSAFLLFYIIPRFAPELLVVVEHLFPF
ncbi:MAG: hypothetical protein FWC66_02755 [Oscillospiraceae bacterium]|nr:hypothetical protein [Oscillospiraceae bacterium]